MEDEEADTENELSFLIFPKGCDFLILSIILSVVGVASAVTVCAAYAKKEMCELCFCVMLILGMVLAGSGITGIVNFLR